MRPVLFEIPTPWFAIPIRGYGAMLLVALLTCTWLAGRLAERNGGQREIAWDLLFPMTLFGILGARLFYFVQYFRDFDHWYEFLFLWEGGLVIYGGAIAGVVVFLVFAHRRRLEKLWLLDVVTPSLALGMAIGRMGCLLYGCCYGDYCQAPWAMQFPAGSPPHGRMVVHGHQTRLGFLALGDDRRVLVVEPGSDAERQGLRVGDRIVDVNGTAVENAKEMARAILLLGTRDDRQSSSVLRSPVDPLAFDESFDMTVERDGSRHAITIHPAATLPIHPTQVYSSISNLLLFSVLLSFYPLRRRDGEVVALFAMLYPISRFLIEYLRYDEPALIDGLTISQNLSILLFMLGAMVWLSVRRRPAQYLRRSALSAASKSAA